jgi:hypothetical protein
MRALARCHLLWMPSFITISSSGRLLNPASVTAQEPNVHMQPVAY